MAHSKEIQDLLQGDPFGKVYPAKDNPPPTPEDGRTIALRVLRKYISELTFYRLGPLDEHGHRCAPIPFRIPSRDILIGWPDNEENLNFPSMVFLSTGSSPYVPIGLTSYVEENTRDVYAPGTVLQWMSEYTENFAIELWASSQAELRSMISGLEVSMTPTEQMYGLRFKMPDYYNELVCFSLGNKEIFDEQDAVRNRRRARLYVELRHNIVALVNYTNINPVMKVDVDVDQDTNLAISLEEPKDRRDIRLPRGPLGPTTPFDDDC